MYEHLERQATELRRRGLTEIEIRSVLKGDIDVYFRKFMSRVSREFESRRQDLARLVGDEFLMVVEEMFDLGSRLLERVFTSQTVFGTALHMRSAAERIRKGYGVETPDLSGLQSGSPAEYAAAAEMGALFAERTGIPLQESEIGLLATILLSTTERTAHPKVGVLVLAYGTSTAASMLEAAQQLLGTTHGAALDVPLYM